MRVVCVRRRQEEREATIAGMRTGASQRRGFPNFCSLGDSVADTSEGLAGLLSELEAMPPSVLEQRATAAGIDAAEIAKDDPKALARRIEDHGSGVPVAAGAEAARLRAARLEAEARATARRQAARDELTPLGLGAVTPCVLRAWRRAGDWPGAVS